MFKQANPKNFHVQYLDVTRHWSPRSENFAGGDSLLTAINRGWEIHEEVHRTEHWHGDARLVTVYHFKLRKNDREIDMPVIENPYIARLLYSSAFDVIDRGREEVDERTG